MRRVRRQHRKNQPISQAAVGPQLAVALDDGAVTLAMIQALIPLGLKAVEERLRAEVTALAGARYAHADGASGVVRWGQQRGSIYLADQKLPVTVPRVRDRVQRREVPFTTYQTLTRRPVPTQSISADVTARGRVTTTGIAATLCSARGAPC